MKKLIAFIALALLACGLEKSQAQNNWTNTGPSPGGGYIIIGNSAPTDLGQLSTATTPVFLSPNGFNIITVEPGNTATASYAVDITNNNNVLNNYGTLTGSEYPVYIYGANNVINNWGTVSSANDPVWEEGTQNNTFNNFGLITNTGSGDYDVYTDGNFFTLNNHGTISGATYQAIYSDGSNFTFNNWGTLSVPSSDYEIYSTGNFFTLNNYSGATITAPSSSCIIYTGGNNDTLNNWGAITTAATSYTIYSTGSFMTLNNYSGGMITGSGNSYTIESLGNNAMLNNWGSITGNDNGFTVDISGNNSVLNNYSGGTISCTDGDYAVYLGGSNNILNNWGTVSCTYMAVDEDGSHNTVNNWGAISGPGDYGVFSDGSFFTLNNMGTIGNSTSDTVYSYGGNFTLNNWGMIGTNGGTAIGIDSDNNTLNFLGHSSVYGPISIAGSNNVVNLNFSGLSPATIANLKNILLPQDVNSGNVTTATFTLRGVTYNIDPAIINFNPSSYQLQALTPNQAAIGISLDSLTYNPAPGTSLFAMVNAIDQSGNVPGALEELSPQKYEIYGDLAIANANFDVTSIDARLNNLRDGSESIDTSGIGGTTVAGLTKDDSSKESKEIHPATPAPNRWGFFATGNGLFFRGNPHDVDAQAGKADTAGTIAGIDAKAGDHGVLGAFFAYDNSATTMGGDNSHATIESYTGGIYGSYHNDGFHANGLAAYARNNYSSNRNILIPGFDTSADGSTNGNQYTANIDGGYDWNVTDRVTVGPVAGVQYVHLDVDGFNESGAGAADLAIGSQNMNSLQSRLGARVNFHLATTQTSSAAIDLHAAWQHEYLDDSRGIGASFEGAGALPFAVQTASPLRDAAVVGLGLNFSFHDRLTLFAEYELELWNASYFEQTVNGGARISF